MALALAESVLVEKRVPVTCPAMTVPSPSTTVVPPTLRTSSQPVPMLRAYSVAPVAVKLPILRALRVTSASPVMAPMLMTLAVLVPAEALPIVASRSRRLWTLVPAPEWTGVVKVNWTLSVVTPALAAGALVKAMFSVPAKVKSTSVLKVAAPLAVKVPVAVAAVPVSVILESPSAVDAPTPVHLAIVPPVPEPVRAPLPPASVPQVNVPAAVQRSFSVVVLQAERLAP